MTPAQSTGLPPSVNAISPKPATQGLDIRPEVGVFSALQHLNYKVWYALAEFVDNSIQSAIDNIDLLRAMHGSEYRLRVDIIHDATPGAERLIIRDNAGGIPQREYPRAFRLACLPQNRSGLSEFGMGMKTAGCWLADRWSVRTSALGESVEGRIEFDVAKVIAEGLETIHPSISPAASSAHFTEITLEGLRHNLHGGRTIGKIRSHLADIFRAFIRDGGNTVPLDLTYGGERVEYANPKPLVAPFHERSGVLPTGPSVTWLRQVDLTLPVAGVRITGHMGLLERGSTTRAGFALMRRNRLIRGIDGETYRPEEIFGRSNSFAYQRLFGELTLEGVRVSHTKDSFELESIESELISALRAAADDPSLPLLRQAANFRATLERAPDRGDIASKAASGTVSEIAEHPDACVAGQDILDGSSDAAGELTVPGSSTLVDPPASNPMTTPASRSRSESRSFDVDGESWTVCLELVDDPAIGDWVGVKEVAESDGRTIQIVFGLAHPFVQRFSTPDASELEPLVRLACSIGLAEVAARRSGVQMAGCFRRVINRLLRDAMSNH